MQKAFPVYKVLSDQTKNEKENCLMYNSIIDFTENDTAKIRKILEKYPFSGNALRFEEDLMRVSIEFDRKIYQECLKEIIYGTINERNFDGVMRLLFKNVMPRQIRNTRKRK